MLLPLDEELKEQVRRSASRNGSSFEVELERLLELGWEEWDRQDAIKGIQRGLDDVAAGRVRPASEFFEDLERKYSFLR
jgi:predicted transcriptional regulator